MKWKCGNDGRGSRPWFVYQEYPATAVIAKEHTDRLGRLIKFASHDSAHRRMLQLNEAP